jgi:hypothetical protein
MRMLSVWLLFLLAIGLAGCESAEHRQARLAAIAAADDGKCRSYGGEPGTPAYVQCRAQLDAARTQAQATAAAALANAPPAYTPPPVYTPPPMPQIATPF